MQGHLRSGEARLSGIFHATSRERMNTMDKDRVIGSAKVIKGKAKIAVGKAIGDAKLEAEDQTDKVKGKI
jgi:hypothetical protein